MIGLGRLLLASLYLIAIALDASQPTSAPVEAFAVLTAYFAFACVTVAATWKDWWLDAKIAGFAHAVDILFFMLLVLLTEGYTSPYFTFFMFVLLAAAIRWGWRATALSSLLLVLLYLLAGMIAVQSSPQVELQRFAVRTGHLLILSMILIWFGVSRWGLQSRTPSRPLIRPPSLDQPPVETALRAAMTGLRAKSGHFLWRSPDQRDYSGVTVRDDRSTPISAPAATLNRATAVGPFLYDVAEQRGLSRDAQRNLVELDLAELIGRPAAQRLGLREGLAVPVRSGDGNGTLFLDGIPGLATDYIELGEHISAEVAAHVQAHALLRAADEGAEARSRLTLARDLHDGVVQFLAATAFRLEAMRRAQGSDRDLGPELDELKQLVLQEQHELRTFITALRAGPVLSFDDLAVDLRALAGRLSRQWDVGCTLTAEPSDKTVPTRLQLDAQQLIREAVANAVRHAQARLIRIALSADDGELRLVVMNDGAAPRSPSGRLHVPKSLKERVEKAGGTLDFARGMDVTKVSIALPIVARPR